MRRSGVISTQSSQLLVRFLSNLGRLCRKRLLFRLTLLFLLTLIHCTAHRTTIECQLPDDSCYSISREQVPLLLNFSMTAHASQGRTRPFNPVQLTDCDSHQSYYVCLSRSAEADNTVIIGDISPSIITGKLSAQLRQEFRVLEILDEVTRMRYEGEIIIHSPLESRLSALLAYKSHHKNVMVCPPHVHRALRWSDKDPVKADVEWSEGWQSLERKTSSRKQSKPIVRQKSDFVPLSQVEKLDPKSEKANREPSLYSTTASAVSSKLVETHLRNPTPRVPHNTDGRLARKRKQEDEYSKANLDRRKRSKGIPLCEMAGTMPVGLVWDNNSCAYDSLFVILCHHLKSLGAEFFSCPSISLSTFFESISEASKDTLSLEDVRNLTAASLRQQDPINIRPLGAFASPTDIYETLFLFNGHYITRETICRNGCLQDLKVKSKCTSTFIISQSHWQRLFSGRFHLPNYRTTTTQEWLSGHLDRIISTKRICTHCGTNKIQRYHLRNPPMMLYFDFQHPLVNDVEILSYISLGNSSNQEQYGYKLAGVIYFGQDHFVSRIVTDDGLVWYHDGIATGKSTAFERRIDQFTKEEMGTVRRRNQAKRIHSAIYRLVFQKLA